TYAYDDKDRPIAVTLPGGVSNSTTYYANDVVHTHTDFNGTVLANTLDGDGKITHRTINPATGVEGSLSETITYDGLGRVKSIENDDAITAYVYNQEGLVEKEIQKHKTNGAVTKTYEVDYEYDANGNRVKLSYPSLINPSEPNSTRKEVVYTPDELDRVKEINSGSDKLVRYGYEGMAKVMRKELFNNAVTMTSDFDLGKRPENLIYKNGNTMLLNREMKWNTADIKDYETFSGITRTYKYDTFLRLRNEEDKENNIKLRSIDFGIDDIENIKTIDSPIVTQTGIPAVDMVFGHNNRHQITNAAYKQPLNDSGLNLQVKPTYDANGNMTAFIHKYTYNYRNQLVGVVTGTGLNIEYKYDAPGRRIEKKVTAPNGTTTTRYVYAGWQVIEEWNITPGSEVLKARYVYGNGIDERILLEYDLPGDNTNELESFIPIRNSIGNVTAITDSQGKVVEKYDYSTYGAPKFIHDTIPPVVNDIEQVVTTGTTSILVRVSEALDSASLQGAVKITAGGNEVTGTVAASEDSKSFTADIDGDLEAGDLIEVKIENITDKEGNRLQAPLEISFPYTGQSKKEYDGVKPELVNITYKKSNELHLLFSEEINPEQAQSGISLMKGEANIAFSVSVADDKRWVVKTDAPLVMGAEYKLWVKPTLQDDSGKAITESLHRFVVINDDFPVFQKSDPNVHTNSRLGNNYLFHGRTYEPEIGLYYYRHRYYMPGIGRFIQTDPMGYNDSMNMYQAFNQNPVNFVDPMGEKIQIPNGSNKDSIFNCLSKLTDDELERNNATGKITIRRRKRGTKPKGTALVRRLLKSNKMVTIKYTGSRVNQCGSDSSQSVSNESNGKGVDCTVELDPKDYSPLLCKVDGYGGRLTLIPAHPEITLGHELIHADHFTTGQIRRDAGKGDYSYKIFPSDLPHTISEDIEELETCGIHNWRLSTYTVNHLAGRNMTISQYKQRVMRTRRKSCSENDLRKEWRCKGNMFGIEFDMTCPPRGKY
ncbi:MAG: hypothetical protein GY765_25965, partial [bacterium]|nr:hypothetical protein [bacterium]